MSGLCGFVSRTGAWDEAQTMSRMLQPLARSADPQKAVVSIAGAGLGAAGRPGRVDQYRDAHVSALLFGFPSRGGTTELFAATVAKAYLREGPAAMKRLEGAFVAAVLRHEPLELFVGIDRMGIYSLAYSETPAGFAFGTNSDSVIACTGASPVDPQSIFDYLYFHVVPAPASIYRGHSRLPPGGYVLHRNGSTTVGQWWQPQFVEHRKADFRILADDFRSRLRAAVGRYAGTGDGAGAFLSGGTDSSTVSGVLCAVAAAPARTYSIGFDAQGYDEMEYARIAARHFGTLHHEHYVTPREVVDAVPRVAAAYDQPFGNASAVPALYCARMAAQDGVRIMLAGDGGDELFGGNARYAVQYLLSLYSHIPVGLRRAGIEPLVAAVPFGERLPPIRKLRSYIRQASLPMPARYETYNLLERIGMERIFTRDFLAQVDRESPHRQLEATCHGVKAESLINLMLGIDWKFTLADNDLRKVTEMCDLAGVDAAFPLLDHEVVDFSLALAPSLKLRRTKLRYFFKEALRGFLPDQIITKSKHGFGLPVGVWLRDDPGLRALAGDSLSAFKRRGILKPQFTDELVDELLPAHPGYYGTLVWVTMMLEQWFAAHEASVT